MLKEFVLQHPVFDAFLGLCSVFSSVCCPNSSVVSFNLRCSTQWFLLIRLFHKSKADAGYLDSAQLLHERSVVTAAAHLL